jgi:hypothetical protein
MSNAIAHRPHVHHVRVPMMTVIAVLVAIAIAAAVIYAANRPETATTASHAVAAPAAAPAASITVDDRKGPHGIHGITQSEGVPVGTPTDPLRDAKGPHRPPPGRD